MSQLINLQRMLRRLADPSRSDSYTITLRRRRLAPFLALVANLPKPLTILDVGGTQEFWEALGLFCDHPDIHIVLANLSHVSVRHSNFSSVVADARNLADFADAEFEVVFSNATLQDLPTLAQQVAMATALRRVGRRGWMQAPNRYFPIDPSFLFPGFQFLALPVRVWLMTHWKLSWYPRYEDQLEAALAADAKRYPTRRELRWLFPGASIKTERWLAMAKSFLVTWGWEP